MLYTKKYIQFVYEEEGLDRKEAWYQQLFYL